MQAGQAWDREMDVEKRTTDAGGAIFRFLFSS
jgi:hypothetical protein